MSVTITAEDKKRYFPLLDDMGGMEEIYTLDELRTRVQEASFMSPNKNHKWWHTKWLKGVELKHNSMWNGTDLYYYGILAARKDPFGFAKFI